MLLASRLVVAGAGRVDIDEVVVGSPVLLQRLITLRAGQDPHLPHIVTTLARGDGTTGLGLLGDRVVEVGRGQGDTALAQAVYALWSDGKDAGRGRPIIVQTQAQPRASPA